MNVIVIGCGRLGSDLAYRLFKAGHQVAVVDFAPEAFNKLPPDFNGRTHEGDALSQDVLLRAGIENADALAVVTNSDALNAVVAQVGKSVFSIPNVVARNFDPRSRALFEDLGLQVVSSTIWGAQRIEEMLYDTSVHPVFSAGNGEVEVYEFVIPAKWKGKTPAELFAHKDCVLVSLTRAGKAALPDLNLELNEGDIVHISATFEGSKHLRSLLKNGKED